MKLKDKIKIGFGSIVGLVTLFSLCFGLTWLGIEWRGFFGPKRQAVEREIFEQTPSYVHGKMQDLTRYRHQYNMADANGKSAIKSTVRLQFSQFDFSTINNPELIAFWQECNR